jgi:hypothetical protein
VLAREKKNKVSVSIDTKGRKPWKSKVQSDNMLSRNESMCYANIRK